MNSTTAAIDLAKDVFQVVLADESGRIVESHRLLGDAALSQYPTLRLRLELTPKEYSSGSTRHLGRISKREDRYLRMLLTHEARSVLRAANAAATRGVELAGIRRWAWELQHRSNHNKAVCALANTLARICYAVLRDHTPFGQPVVQIDRKLNRQAFELAY